MIGKGILKNTVILTLSNIFLRIIGLGFQIYLSSQLGAEGLGLYFLVISVNITAATFAISGARFATTRLVSEEIGMGKIRGAAGAVKSALLYAFLFGTAASVICYLCSPWIGNSILADARSVMALRMLSPGLLFVALGAVLSGYFTGIKQPHKGAFCDIVEVMSKIVFCLTVFHFNRDLSIEKGCAVLTLGSSVGEAISCLAACILFIKGRIRTKSKSFFMMPKLIKISVPLALSAYARTAMSTLQNILTPRGFRKGGASAREALSTYGEIQGMVFPIVTFPAAIFVSLSEVLVPELTRAQMEGKKSSIQDYTSRLLRYCLIFSVGIMGVFIFYANSLACLFYHNEIIAYFIQVLAFLMPVMYLDSVTDGMLRGLGEQNYCMRVNIVDSAVCLFFIWFLLPKYGIYGYLFLLFFSESFNFTLSIAKLKKVSGVKVLIRDILTSLISSFLAGLLLCCLRNIITLRMPSFLALTLNIILYGMLYLLLLVLTGGIKQGTWKSLYHSVKKRRRSKFFGTAV